MRRDDAQRWRSRRVFTVALRYSSLWASQRSLDFRLQAEPRDGRGRQELQGGMECPGGCQKEKGVPEPLQEAGQMSGTVGGVRRSQGPRG
jgi:hypothetical protein